MPPLSGTSLSQAAELCPYFFFTEFSLPLSFFGPVHPLTGNVFPIYEYFRSLLLGQHPFFLFVGERRGRFIPFIMIGLQLFFLL